MGNSWKGTCLGRGGKNSDAGENGWGDVLAGLRADRNLVGL